MEKVVVAQHFQMGMVEESMSRFSLKSRKSSYTSSSRDGSSGTNESMSNSSRPSIADSCRRRSSLASFSSRLKKSKRSAFGDIKEHERVESKDTTRYAKW